MVDDLSELTLRPGQLFPRRMEFARLPFSHLFTNRGEFDLFVSREQELWAPLEGGPITQAQNVARINRRLLNDVGKDRDDERIREALRMLELEFVPLSIGPGVAVAELYRTEPETAGAALATIYQPAGQGFNPQHASYAPGQALRIVLKLYGNPAGFRRDIDDKRQRLDNLLAAAAEAKAGFDADLEDSRAKMAAYATQAALKAPREYWGRRSEAQRRKALVARVVWFSCTLIFCILMTAAVVAAFSPAIATRYPAFAQFLPSAGGDYGWLAALAARLVFLGTLGGVGVWLLRQLLRDVRNHEHLAEDAAERVTMIETLTALQSVGLQSSDLSSILSALYRPAAVAMADDGGPVLPIEVLMKGVADAASKGRS